MKTTNGKKITIKTKPDKYGIDSKVVFKFDNDTTYWKIKMNGTATKTKINTNDIIKEQPVYLNLKKDIYSFRLDFTL